MPPSRDLNGKVVVVTGAARGIGAGVAEAVARRGARVALLGLEPELLAEVRERIGTGAACWEVDVTDSAALDRVAAEVRTHFGRVDVVVANAGIATGGMLSLADPASFDQVIEVNLLGSVRTARAFLPALLDSAGYLLQIASLAAMIPIPGMAAYCTSKSGVEAFAHALRGEVGHRHVDVGVAYLSWVDTDMVRGADATPGLGELRSRVSGGRSVPLERAAEQLVAGIEHRRAHVYVPGWLQAIQPVRWLLPAGTAWLGRRQAPKAEQLLRQGGVEATLPVGPGGAAAQRARRAG